jgi:FkbM family methyltransferase
LLMAHRVGESGKVYSFEPHPVIVKRLVSNVRRNRFEGIVTVLECAVSDVSGSLELSLYQGYPELTSLAADAARPHKTIEVPTTTLDEMFVRGEVGCPRFIKVDVEGAELLVLKGAVQLVEQCRPIIVLEVNQRNQALFGYAPVDIYHWAEEHAYSFSLLHPYKDCQEVSMDTANSLSRGNALLKPRQAILSAG